MPKKINISDDDIRDIIKPELERAKDWASQLADERKRCRELYDMAPLGNEVDGFSQNVDSTVFEVVEWLKPGLAEIYAHPDFFTVKMANADNADMLRRVLRHQLFIQQDGEKLICDYVDDGLKYHNAVWKVCHVEEFDEVEEEYERLSLDEAGQVELSGAEITKYDEVQGVDPATMQPVSWIENVKAIRKVPKFAGPRVDVVPSWEFLITPGSKSIPEAPLCGQRTPRLLHDIKMGELNGKYKKGSYAKLVERAAESQEIEDYLDEKSELYEQDNLSIDEFTVNSTATDGHKSTIPSRQVYVYELYTRLDIDNDGLLEPVIVHMAGDVVLNIQENPYKRPPFYAGSIISMAHRFEGRPLPLVLEHEQLELTNLSRLLTDSAAEAAYATAITNDQNFQMQWANRGPGDSLFVQGNPADKVMFERAPGPDQSVLAAIEMKDGKVERKSGVSRYNQGLDADSLNKTAKGISIISSLSQQKQKFGAKQLGWAIKDVLEAMVQINAMWPPYIDDPELQFDPQLFQQRHTIEIEVGVGPQDRMAQSQFLVNHQQWLTGFAIPAGAATVEHSIKCQAKIGKLQGVPFDDLMLAPDDVQGLQKLQQQIQQMGQQMEQMGQQMQQLQQANQKLQIDASKNSPRLKQMELQADMQVERAKIEADMVIEREKLAAEIQLKREQMAVDAEMAAVRTIQNVQQQAVI